MIKAIIYDLNGVFLESENLHARVAERYKVDGQVFLDNLKEVLAVARKPGCEDSWELWEPRLKKMGTNVTCEDFFNFWFSGESVVHPLVEYAASQREKGLRVFILSNNFKERTEFYRGNFPEIFNAIDKAYFSWETGRVKPDVSAWKGILDEHGLVGEECIYFDDSLKNIAAAESLGIYAYIYEDLDKVKQTITGLI